MKPGRFGKIVRSSAFAMVLALFSAGCWGSREVDEAAYVLAVGLDREPEGDLLFSMAIADVPSAPGPSPSGTPETSRRGTRFFSARAPGFFSGLTRCNALLEKPPNLTHLKLLVFSEELARAGIDEYLDSFVRWREFRRTVYIAVAKGRAAPIIASLAEVREDETGRYLELMLVNQSLTGFIPSGQFLRFYNDYKTKGHSPLAITVAARKGGKGAGPPEELPAPGHGVLEGDSPIQFTGAAIFKGGRMIGRLNAEETMAVGLMRGDLRQTFVTLPLPAEKGAKMEFRVMPARKPCLVMVRRGRGIRFDLTLFLRAEVVNIERRMGEPGIPGLAAAERALAEWFEERCRAVFAKAQSLRADFLGFAGKARWLAPDWPAWRRWNWEAGFAEAPLHLKVEVDVDQTGLIVDENILREE